MAEKYISQFTAAEIDERLQAVSEKYGYINVRADNDKSVYVFDCYASEDDYLNGEEPINSIETPIASTKGTVYTAFLTGSIGNTVDIVVAEKKLEVAFNYRAVQIVEGLSNNADAQGTLIVQRQTSTTSWTTVGELKDVLPSSAPTDTETVKTVDIGEFIAKGKQSIRVQAVYNITDEETGEEKTIRSGYVMVGQSVNYVELRLTLNRDYWTPINAFNVNGEQNKFPVDYNVYGAVQKTLHVEIKGSTGTYTLNHELAASFDSRPTENLGVDDIDGYGLLTHGVHKVTAWLSCGDGLGGTITSPKLVNRLMVYNVNATEEERMKPKLMLQDIDVVGNTVENFVQKNICNYAVYSPKKNEDGTITNEGDAVSVIFMLTSYTEDYETQKPDTEYYRLEINVPPAQKNELLTTVEIESESTQTAYETYFRVRRVEDGAETDFIKESTNEVYYPVTVDNSRSFAPISGATFLLNPKVRNNSETNPMVIYNAANKNAVVEAEFVNFGFINDGWVTASDNQKVLRIMAGEKLRINTNPLKQFATTPASSMTMVIDYKVSNVTDEDTPIISLSEANGSTFKGLRMNALGGWIKPASQSNDDNLFFGWQEDVRTQMILNINHAVKPNKGDVQYPSNLPESTVNGSIALARVMINGDVVREVPFSTTDKAEWCSTTDNWLEIGNEGADIDIYSIRIYEDRQLEVRNLHEQNYVSSLPTSEEKVAEREKNDLIENDRISLEKTQQRGLNCYVWHGNTPYHEETGTQTGWLELFRYDDNGNYLPEYSGTICKESKALPLDGQGSTAKTYWDWNLQDKVKDAEAKIWVAVEQFHESIHIRIEESEGKAYIYGGNLGKNEPIDPKEKAYSYVDGMIEVPDGWIDGNGMYRGMGYQVAAGTAQSLKNNLKINYASSMQSHLIGACKSYNLLHQAVVGKNSIQEQYSGAVTAKMLEPFMVFYVPNEENGAIFKGMGTYGAAKADKVAWGYVEDLHPMFAMIEGSDNNLPLTDFRVPFDHKVIPVLDSDGEMEGWSYAGVTNYDYNLGRLSEDGKDAAPEIRKKWSEIHNYIYLHAPHLKYFKGTFAEFKQSTEAKTGLNNKYWCTDSTDGKWYLYRYDWVDGEWVDAGLWSDTLGAYKPVELKSDVTTKATYEAAVSSGTSTNYSAMNRLFNIAIVGHGKDYIEYFIKSRSLKFNYCFTLGLNAGTDNSSKNTYHVIDPKARTVEDGAEFAENATFSAWFLDNFGYEFDYTSIYQAEEHGDDMDSIFSTNNNANLTKPYYIDRMHPYKDDNEANGSLYEGMGNALFNFCEWAYEDSKELQTTMHSIMDAMCNLVGDEDKIYGTITTRKSLWGFYHKYFFNIQHYFPKIAYIEQNRIRYEFPELLGFVSSGDGARSISPITQALGSQLENEQQFLNRRLIYFASYAAFGALGKDGDIGLPDATDSQNWVPATLPDGNPADYVLTLTPHQYIYPTAFVGQTVVDPHVRVAAGKSYAFTVATNVSGSDTGMGIKGANYYSDYGNLGTLSTTSTFTVVGKRLKSLNAYSSGSISESPFRGVMNVNALYIRYIYINGTGNKSDTFDFSLQKRLESCEVSYSSVLYMVVPSTHTLKKIYYPRNTGKVILRNIVNLESLTVNEGYKYTNLTEVVIENVGTNTGLNVQSIIENIYNYKVVNRPSSAKDLTTLSILNNFTWSNLSKEVMSWMLGIENLELKGKISIAGGTGTDYLSYADTVKMIELFGDVQSEANGLYVDYPKFPINGMTVEGSKYIRKTGEWSGWNLSLLPVIGNNVAISGKREAVRWSFAEDGYTQYATWKDAVKGVLQVNALQENAKFTLHVEMDTLLDNGTLKTLSFDKKVGFYDRKPKLNDFAYGDGEFDDELDLSKDLVGNVIYLKEETDGKVNGFVFAKESVTLKSTEVLYTGSVMNSASVPWGIYPVTDTTTESEKAYGFDEETREEIRQSLASIYPGITLNEVTDLPMTSLYDTGMDNEDGSMRYYLTDINEYGDSPFIDKNKADGYAVVSGDVAINRFDSVGEADIVMQRVADMYNTYFISEDDPLETAEVQPTTLEELANQMVLRANQANSDNDTMPTKHYQLYFPATHAARLYEPAVTEGRTLHDMYKRGKWQLPSTGLMARVFNFYYNSCGIASEDGTVTRRKLTSEGGAFGAQFANESEPFEALMPLFANLYARILNKMPNASLTSPYVFPTASIYWTGTESYDSSAWHVNFGSGHFNTNYKQRSNVGRGVAAFEFTPTE